MATKHEITQLRAKLRAIVEDHHWSDVLNQLAPLAIESAQCADARADELHHIARTLYAMAIDVAAHEIPLPPHIHAFQTGRLYTASGQRIAWCVLASGNIAMRDIDRLIDYLLPAMDAPSNSKVLDAYDDGHGDKAVYSHEDRDEQRAMSEALGIAAAMVAAPAARGGGK